MDEEVIPILYVADAATAVAWQADLDRLTATRYRYQLPYREHTTGTP